jgi:uncharacterized protein with von Willebrand factor type A (vWA) domain
VDSLSNFLKEFGEKVTQAQAKKKKKRRRKKSVKEKPVEKKVVMEEDNGLLYNVSRWQKFLWSDHKTQEPSARKTEYEGRQLYEAFDEFGSDVFHRLYASDEEKRDPAPEGIAWADRLHNNLEKLPEFDRLKQRCMRSEWWAGIGTTALLNAIIAKSTHKEIVEDARPDQRTVEYLKELLAETEDPKDQGKVDDLLKEAQERLDGKLQQDQDVTGQINDSAFREAARKAIETANNQIDDIESAVSAFSRAAGSADHTGQLSRNNISYDLIRLLIENKQLREIAEIAGRLQLIAKQKQQAKTRKGTNEVAGIVQGDDLARLLPSEAICAVTPELEPIFARRFTEKQLLQYQITEKENEGKGPIVILVDASGSMAGNKHVWASGVCLAFAQIAQQQKRALGILHFGTKVVSEDMFPANKPMPMQQLIESITRPASAGGTAFMEPLVRTIWLIGHEDVFNDADIVMITDGQASVNDKFMKNWKKAQKDLGFNCYSILIGNDCNKTVAEKFSDEVVILADVLRDDKEVHRILGMV